MTSLTAAVVMEASGTQDLAQKILLGAGMLFAAVLVLAFVGNTLATIINEPRMFAVIFAVVAVPATLIIAASQPSLALAIEWGCGIGLAAVLCFANLTS